MKKQLVSEAVADYILWRASQDYSKHTLNNERYALQRFTANCKDIQVARITSQTIDRHFMRLAETQQPSSLAFAHGVLKRFLEWARKTGRLPVDTDPMFGRRKPKASVKERNRLDASEFPRLLEVAGERDPRDRACVALFLYSLCRSSEIRTMALQDLNLDSGRLKVVIHKTRQEDFLPVSAELDAEMRAWLSHYAVVSGPLKGHMPLVPARWTPQLRDGITGRYENAPTLYRPTALTIPREPAQLALAKVGFPLREMNGRSASEGGHTLRRSGARALFDALVAEGYDYALRVVQSMLHHASVTQTEKYIGITADRRSRDELLTGQTMYPQAKGADVLRIAR